jgi:acyl-CoA thioester hydrolase
MRFRLRNEFFTDERKLAARVTSSGGWLDLTARKLVTPPEALARLMRDLARSPDYADLPARA